MKRLEQQLRSLLAPSRGGGVGSSSAEGGGAVAAGDSTTSAAATLRPEESAHAARPLAATRNTSAAPTEGTAFDNASSSGDKNSDGEGSASRGATTAAKATATKPGAGTAATARRNVDADETSSSLPSPSPAPPRAPASFYCPISMELMADPVVVATGHTYDRRCIERWLSAGHSTCPATGARLRHLELTPNFALRDAVAEWALREGVPVPQPEDGGGRTAAALLYKGGGGEGAGGGGRGVEAASSGRRRAAAAAAAARFAEEAAATPAANEEADEEDDAPRRRRQQQQVTAAAAAAAAAAEEAATTSSDASLLQPPPTILRGHDEIVWAVEASGGRLFSASADRSVRVWDVASRRCEAVLEDHARPVLCLALAPAADAVAPRRRRAGPGNPDEEEDETDDDLLFSGSYDFTIKAWSLRTLSRVKTLTGHADAVRSLLYVPPKKGEKEGGRATASSSGNSSGSSSAPLGRRGRLFSASYDGTVRVWDVATLEPVATLPGHSGPVRTLATVDGLVFSGSYDKTIRAWHADSLIPAACLTGHTAAVRALSAVDRSKIRRAVRAPPQASAAAAAAAAPGETATAPPPPLGPLLFSGSDDGTVRAWCPRTLVCVATLLGHEDNVRVLAATTGGGGGAGGGDDDGSPPLLFSGSWDRTVRAWCLRTLKCVRVLRGHGEAVLALAVGRRCVASGSYDASVRLWDLAGIVEGGADGDEAAGAYAGGGDNDEEEERGRNAAATFSSSSSVPRPPPASRACAGHEDAVRVLTADGEGHVFSGSYDGSVGIWSEEGF